VNTPDILNKYTHYATVLPSNTFLFTDKIPIHTTDYSSNIHDVVELLITPEMFYHFLKSKLSRQDNIDDDISQYNINSLLKILFKIGNKFYMSNHIYIIVKYKWDNNINNVDIPYKESDTVIQHNISIQVTLKQTSDILHKDPSSMVEKWECDDIKDKIHDHIKKLKYK
jgi:hypothetical protein